MFCCRTPNRQRATISYFGLIGNWLKRRARFIMTETIIELDYSQGVMHLADFR